MSCLKTGVAVRNGVDRQQPMIITSKNGFSSQVINNNGKIYSAIKVF